MKENKLLYFLRRLSAKERKAFHHFVDSPLFNRRSSLKKLLEVVDRFCASGNPLPTPETLYALVYGEQPFNENSLKTAMSQLFSLLRDFLAFSKYQEDKIGQQRYFIEKLNVIEADKYFSKYHSAAVTSLQKMPINSADRHFEQLMLEEAFLVFRQRMPARQPENRLDSTREHLMMSMLIRMLRYELQQSNMAGVFQTNSSASPLQRKIIELVADQPGELPITVQAYSLLLSALEQPNAPEAFFEAREVLTASGEALSPLEASELYISALNYTTRHVNEGKVEFLQHSFELYAELMERKLLMQNDQLSPFHFKNMVNVALRLQKFEWTEKLIATWRHAIHPDHAENAYHFNQGMLHFYQKEYADAERSFHQVLQDYQDVFYGLNARGYLLQIHYEMQDLRSLESLAHSFRVKLSRSKNISEAKKEQYLSFIRHLMQLLNTPLHDQKRLQKLRDKITEKTKKGMGTVWLLAKIDLLLEA